MVGVLLLSKMQNPLPEQVILAAIKASADVYPAEKDFIVDRSIDGYTILAVEGTTDMSDWATNIKFLLMDDGCHRGFKSNAQRTLSELVLNYEALNPERVLVLTGHSLGGATATIIADQLLPFNDNIALVTAGSPRPGGRKLKKRLEKLNHYRFVHGDDVVPKTPPYLNGYVHTHPKIYLEDTDDTRFDGVDDHNVQYYYKAVKRLYNL